MKKTFLLSLALVALIPMQASKIVTDSVQSSILGKYIKYNIYLPNNFETSSKTYPVVYLLHGLSDNHNAWRDRGNMQTVADELIESGEAREMLIVMPNAGDSDTHNVPCGYFNMPNWNYEDFFFQEFIPAVEKKYHGVGDKGHRAVMGLSMGGGGSTVYCQRHPDAFSSCYAMSAWLDNQSNNVGPGQKKDWLYYTCEAVKNHSALKFIEEADDATKEKLCTVKWFFDCGDDDFLFDLSVCLHQLMRGARIKDELRIRNGVHNWEYWHQALRIALPYASRNFDK
ncbi:MAG: alpha/beta fold hydrolase [Bacteroidaceae bacterium]|nr:alpha/beta fold hydrolase [Bacteroidaceae bacterium]